MANQVFANGREVSCKAADGKSSGCFPDVCFSPPTPPPTGVPVAYFNSAFASDTTAGSKTVEISGKEVMLRDKSYFKKSTGNEAATEALNKGFLTRAIRGKAYFCSWSMDVKLEGENAVRDSDLTTHNHGSSTNTLPWAYLDEQTLGKRPSCYRDYERAKKACRGGGSKEGWTETNEENWPTTASITKNIDLPNGKGDENLRELHSWARDQVANLKEGEILVGSSSLTPAGRDVLVTCSKKKQPINVTKCTNKCREAKACILTKKCHDKKHCCWPDNTGDHMIEVNCFTQSKGRGGLLERFGSREGLKERGIVVILKGEGQPPSGKNDLVYDAMKQKKAILNLLKQDKLPPGKKIYIYAPDVEHYTQRLSLDGSGFDKYDQEEAPTACVPAPNANGYKNLHNAAQAARDAMKRACKWRLARDGRRYLKRFGTGEKSHWTYGEAADIAVYAHWLLNRHCKKSCIRIQLDRYHKEESQGPQVQEKTPLRCQLPEDNPNADHLNSIGGWKVLSNPELNGGKNRLIQQLWKGVERAFHDKL